MSHRNQLLILLPDRMNMLDGVLIPRIVRSDGSNFNFESGKSK